MGQNVPDEEGQKRKLGEKNKKNHIQMSNSTSNLMLLITLSILASCFETELPNIDFVL